MKNKKFTIGLILLIAGTLTFTFCTKNKTDAAPVADKDLSAATDAGKVELIVSDLGEIAAQTCDGGAALTFYSYNVSMPIPNTALTSFPAIITNDVINKIFYITFNNTYGQDGKVRNGVISYNYSSSVLNAVFMRQVGFRAVVTATAYTVGDINNATGVVDAYSVTVNNMSINNTTPQGFNKATTDLTWSQIANLSIAKPNGGGTITYNGTRNKDLLNTSTTGTLAAYSTSTASIVWQNAKVGFSGSATGMTASNESYSVSIDPSTSLTRDYFYCSPEGLVYPQKHPFISGKMILSFPNEKTKAIRYFDYGAGTCDYNVAITINGITYPQDID